MNGTLLKAALAAVVFGVVALAGAAGDPPAPKAAAAPRGGFAPEPKAGRDDGLIWTRHRKTGTLTAYTPEGKVERTLTPTDGSAFLELTAGGELLFAGSNARFAGDAAAAVTVHARPVGAGADGAAVDTGFAWRPGDVVFGSPDGKHLMRVGRRPMNAAGELLYEHTLFDRKTKAETKVELAPNLYVVRWAPGGKAWHAHEYVRADLRNPDLPRYRMMAVPVGGGKATPLCDGASLITFEPTAAPGVFHAVGHAHANPVNEDEEATYRRWFRVGPNGRLALVKQFDQFDSVELVAAPDRVRVALLARTAHGDASDTILFTFAADGTGEKRLATLPGDGIGTQLLGWFPRWR